MLFRSKILLKHCIKLELDTAEHLNSIVVIMFRVLNSYNKVTFERGLIGAYINLRGLNCIVRIDNNSYLVVIPESILKSRH